jgi:hypothetical protein
MSAVETTLVAALTPHRESTSWPLVLAEHINIALKCQLSRQADLPQVVHRGFARARGLAFFPWFDQWIEALAGNPATFLDGFRALPQAVAEACESLVAIAARTASGPPSINLALAQGERTAVLVIPDHWSDPVTTAIGQRWRMVAPTLMREGAWRRSVTRDQTPVIVFGEAGRDSLVDELLAHRAVQFERSPQGGDIVVALVPAPVMGTPWRLAVAVGDQEVAADFAVEQAMDLFHGVARFAGHRFVSGDGLAPAAATV